jgi:hypothetical protein
MLYDPPFLSKYRVYVHLPDGGYPGDRRIDPLFEKPVPQIQAITIISQKKDPQRFHQPRVFPLLSIE